MRNALRRIALGVLGTGMIAAMAAGATTVAANAAVTRAHETTAKPAVPQETLTWPTVGPGDQSERVWAIQYLLDQAGFGIKVDGKYGASTTTAVKAFQVANGLASDGKVGPATWPALIVTVKESANGDAVRAVQRYLNAYGYTLPVNGYFDAATTKAVVAFQTKYKKYITKADGIVGSQTWITLVHFAA
jgi:peptidoglycan hydrolase-like protein with peptidoglycan-binding domain